MDMSRTTNEQAIEFVSEHQEIFFQNVSTHLESFIHSSFLKTLFEKNPSVPVNKAQLLITMFGESANPANFTSQAQATNISPNTLSLIFSIAFYVSSSSWDSFKHHFYTTFGDMGDDDTDDAVDESSEDEIELDDLDRMIDNLGEITPNPVIDKPPVLPDVEMTPVDQTVTPKTSQKNKQTRVSADKQTMNQSTMAKPDAQTSAKIPQQKGKKSPDNETNQILTGYEAVRKEQERIQDIIVYDIPYTWDLQKILAELKLWGNTIKCSLKRQHKYQTLRVKIALSSFTLPQFNKFWTTDLGGKVSGSNQPKKKDKQQSSTTAPKNNNQLKNPEVQKKAKNTSKNKGHNTDNKEVLAEILSLLRKLV
ncbi:hypothetical protein C1646_805900 [Rhizophagus diaphanus]|nr:hypothetical protein C1646_805900 [Rhizophagus diaphanus] [Rhizophagus sp. MUCL 43196]